ncbi:response regulator [candidate division KSB1 bacterium]|nr:response regulator [candidate division KSB1 bacterium]
MNVLVIENEQFLAENICQFLQQQDGVNIEHIGRVRDALDILSHRSFDLVLSDIQLPDAPDDNWLLEIGKIYPGQKVIVMSSHKLPDKIKTSKSLNIIGYFEKPFDMNQLTTLLKP